ncbi:MAG TPA: MFS transporter [Gemmatimonadales bacterium]|nr:MFS transporter [Gemmatimonadales bacterium]
MAENSQGEHGERGEQVVVPKPVRGLGFVSLFNDFASEMVYPVLPAFVLTLGGGAVALGALDGAADLTSAALKWVSGRLSDRPGWRKPLILGGYLSAVLIRPLIAVASAAWQVIGFRVVDRVGKGLRTPPRDALIADLTPPASRGRAFGFHRAADHFGAVLGSLAAWVLLERGTDVHRVIELSLLPGLVAFLVLAVVLRSVRSQVAPPAAKSEATGRVFWTPVLVLAFVVLARMPEALLLLRLQDAGVAVAVIPLVWAGLHVVRTAASYPGGALTDRVGAKWSVAIAGVLAALVMAAFALDLSVAAAILAMLAFGLVAGFSEPAERALVSRLSPNTLGRGFGAYHAVVGVAALPAALIFGFLMQREGNAVAFGVSAVALVVATGVWVGMGAEG